MTALVGRLVLDNRRLAESGWLSLRVWEHEASQGGR